MVTEIHWEIQNSLNTADNNVLASFIDGLDQIIQKFPFFSTREFAKPMHINIIIVDDMKIREINRDFRKKDETTDVLTFPFDTGALHPGEENIAEIYISRDTALRQSLEQKLTLVNELVILIVHGLLHAFGYDHEESKESSIEMKKYEQQVLNQIGLSDLIPLTN